MIFRVISVLGILSSFTAVADVYKCEGSLDALHSLSITLKGVGDAFQVSGGKTTTAKPALIFKQGLALKIPTIGTSYRPYEEVMVQGRVVSQSSSLPGQRVIELKIQTELMHLQLTQDNLNPVSLYVDTELGPVKIPCE